MQRFPRAEPGLLCPVESGAGSPLPDGRVDLIAVVSGYTIPGSAIAGAEEVLPGGKILFRGIVINAFLPSGAGGAIFRRFADQSFRSEFLAVAVEGEGAHR